MTVILNIGGISDDARRKCLEMLNVCTLADGKKLAEVFRDYYCGKPIKKENKDVLDRLVMAGFIEYVLKDDVAYAQASPIAKGLMGLMDGVPEGSVPCVQTGQVAESFI